MGILVLISVTAVLAMLDITIKSCIENGITRKEERETLKGKVILRKVYNRGFGLNVLQNDPGKICIFICYDNFDDHTADSADA